MSVRPWRSHPPGPTGEPRDKAPEHPKENAQQENDKGEECGERGDDEGWIPAATLAEIDEWVQTCAAGDRTKIGLQASQMPHGEMTRDQLEAEYLQSKGETKWLRQRLETLQQQLERQHLQYQQDHATWQRQFETQALVYKQQMESLNTQLGFAHIQEHQLKWHPASMGPPARTSPAMDVEDEDGSRTGAVETTLNGANVMLTKMPQTIVGSVQIPDALLLEAFSTLQQVKGWAPSLLQTLWTHTVQNHTVQALGDASALLWDSFQRRQYAAAETLVHWIVWLSTRKDTAWMEAFQGMHAEGNPRHVAMVVFELVLQSTSTHASSRTPGACVEEGLLVALAQTLCVWLAIDPAQYVWLLYMYQSHLRRIEWPALLHPSLGGALPHLLRWLVYMVPALPAPSAERTTPATNSSAAHTAARVSPPLKRELVKGLDPHRTPYRAHFARLAFHYFDRFPHTLPLPTWILLAHDTWQQLVTAPRSMHPAHLNTLYLCLAHLHAHPPAHDHLDGLPQRTLHTLLSDIRAASDTLPPYPAVPPRTTPSQRIALRCLRRYHRPFLLRLHELAEQLCETLFPSTDVPMDLPFPVV